MSENKALMKHFVIDMPDNAKPLGFDPMSDAFDWTDVMPDNYWSMEGLDERKEALGGWPVLTPSHMALQPVFDPQDDEDKRDMSPKLVLFFKENSPALVFNKSRSQIASKLTGTRNPRLWAERLPRIVLMNGIWNQKAQIIFDLAPKANVDDINDELF